MQATHEHHPYGMFVNQVTNFPQAVGVEKTTKTDVANGGLSLRAFLVILAAEAAFFTYTAIFM